jgi:hypothetical protein
VCRNVVHAPSTARRAQASRLARKRDESLVPTSRACNSNETVPEQSAAQEGIKLKGNELGQATEIATRLSLP